MAGPTSGLYMNSSGVSGWKSGLFLNFGETISANVKQQMEIASGNQDSLYINYITSQSALFFIERRSLTDLISNWNTGVDSSNTNKIMLLSGASNITYTVPNYLKIDSDLQPVIFYKNGNDIKYIKNTGILSNINSGSFSSGINLKTVAGSYNFGIDFAY
jgi:hypothetical protein